MDERQRLLTAFADFFAAGGLRRLHLCRPEPQPAPDTPELTCHAFAVLQVVLAGRLPFTFVGDNGEIVRTTIRKGEGYFSLPHAWNARTYQDSRRMLMVRFLDERLEYALSHLLPGGRRRNGWLAWQEVPGPQTQTLTLLVRSMCALAPPPAPGANDALLHHLGNALLEAARQRLQCPPAHPSDRSQARWRRIVAHLEESGDTPPGREQLARLFRLSPDHLTRLFHTYAGVPYAEYANRLRIARARQLLTASSLSVKEVAIRCGFRDSSYFVKVFKKITGHTPGGRTNT